MPLITGNISRMHSCILWKRIQYWQIMKGLWYHPLNDCWTGYWRSSYTQHIHTSKSVGTDIYPHMPILRPHAMRRFVRFWASGGAKFTKICDSLLCTPMNRPEKFDFASFILVREIHNHTNKQTNSKWYIHTSHCLSTCVDDKCTSVQQPRSRQTWFVQLPINLDSIGVMVNGFVARCPSWQQQESLSRPYPLFICRLLWQGMSPPYRGSLTHYPTVQ